VTGMVEARVEGLPGNKEGKQRSNKWAWIWPEAGRKGRKCDTCVLRKVTGLDSCLNSYECSLSEDGVQGGKLRAWGMHGE
jgi:hypothetical protein